MIKIVIGLLAILSITSCGGDECGDRDKLDSMRIQTITLKVFPNTKDNGDTWDDSLFESELPADPIFTISSGGEMIATTEVYMPNVTSPTELAFNTWILVDDVDKELKISLWDKDENDDEFIGAVSANPQDMYINSDCGGSFPIIGGNIEIEVLARYYE